MRAIITYHSIDPSGSVISIDEQSFRAHVRWLASGAVRVVPLAELLKQPAADDTDMLAITFDDGAANVSRIAAPILRDHGLSATVFVVSAQVGRSNNWGGVYQEGIPRLELSGWEELARLQEYGLSLGSHTCSHRRLGALTTSQIDDELAAASERITAETGQWPLSFAYPFGDVNDRVEAVVSRYHSLACTTDLRTVSAADDPMRLPRLDAFYLRAPGRLESWGSMRLRAHLQLRAGARRLRRTLAPAVHS